MARKLKHYDVQVPYFQKGSNDKCVSKTYHIDAVNKTAAASHAMMMFRTEYADRWGMMFNPSVRRTQLPSMMGDDERAFWHTILNVPEDWTNRLVYADWLEEHDRPREALAHRDVAANQIVPFVYPFISEGNDDEVSAMSGGDIKSGRVLLTTRGNQTQFLIGDVPRAIWVRCMIPRQWFNMMGHPTHWWLHYSNEWKCHQSLIRSHIKLQKKLKGAK